MKKETLKLKKLVKEVEVKEEYIELYFNSEYLTFIGTNKENKNVYFTFKGDNESVSIDAIYSGVYKGPSSSTLYIKKSFPIDKNFVVYDHENQERKLVNYEDLLEYCFVFTKLELDNYEKD